MKTIKMIIALLLLTWHSSAATIKVLPLKEDGALHGNDLITVAFTATGFLAGQLAQIWLLNSIGPVDVDVPIHNGRNTIQVHIPFSWEPGWYQIGVTAGNASAISQSPVRIRSAIVYPFQRTVIWGDYQSCVKWSTEGNVNADYFMLSLVDEGTGEIYEIAEGINPRAGVYYWTAPPGVKGDFRLVLDGYVVIEEDGWQFKDFSEYARSGWFYIR